MTDSKRLLDEEPDGVEAEPLAAEGSAAPSSDAESEVPIIAGSLAATEATVPRPAPASRSGSVLGATMKGMALGALVTSVALTAAHFAGRRAPVEHRSEAKPTEQKPAEPPPVPSAPAMEEEPPPVASAAEEVSPPVASAVEEAPAPPAAPAPTSPVADSREASTDEAAAFAKAQKAFSHGNMWAATDALDEFDRQFPNGALSLQSEVLRIELLSGRRSKELPKRAQAFLDAHPTAPQARRVKALLEQSKATPARVTTAPDPSSSL